MNHNKSSQIRDNRLIMKIIKMIKLKNKSMKMKMKQNSKTKNKVIILTKMNDWEKE